MCTQSIFGSAPKVDLPAPTPPPEPLKSLAISPEDSAAKRNEKKRAKGTASLRIDRDLSGISGGAGLAIPI